MPSVAERAPEGWNGSQPSAAAAQDFGCDPLAESEADVDIHARRRARAGLLSKGYEVDPFVGPKCGAEERPLAAAIQRRSTQLTVSPSTLFGSRVSAPWPKNTRTPPIGPDWQS